jgi:hypothetical protein
MPKLPQAYSAPGPRRRLLLLKCLSAACLPCPSEHCRCEEEGGMNLYLRKVIHPQARDNYCVILKLDGDEFEIGSIGVQFGTAWAWGIDTVIPMRALETQGEGRDRGTA